MAKDNNEWNSKNNSGVHLCYNIIMDRYVKKGLSVYKIFLKNKIASSIMMLFSGIMMFIAAINGHGNDTKSLPILITSVGAILTLYATYRLGYIKSHLDETDTSQREKRIVRRRALYMQSGETLIYALVAGLGIFLLANEDLTDKVLNLMAGGFTTLNGVLGAIRTYKDRNNKDFRWKMMLVLMVLELVIGPYFIFASDNIDIKWYIVMGALTTVAGLIEVITAMTRENIKHTLDDGKEIARIVKDESNQEQQER